MKVLIKRFLRWLKSDCPTCKVGKLSSVDIYGMNTNVYQCDRCYDKFI
jgi:hypothetical protein